MKGNRSEYQIDGTAQIPASQFQSFLVYARKTGGNTVITIPKPVADYMKLHTGQLINVAIRTISHPEAKKLYGEVPRKYHTAPQLTCPRCGRTGSWIGYQQSVRHGVQHGFQKAVMHYISRRKYPGFFEQLCNMEKTDK